MSKRVAILQSNYIPWKGYFDLIAAVDEFILYDDMQFTKNDWRNRNKIKTPSGPQWLTIPVGQSISRRIRDVTIQKALWQKKHWGSLEANYRKSAHFKEIAAWLSGLYLETSFAGLSEANRAFIEAICKFLEVPTTIKNSWDYSLGGGKSERLVDLCLQAGASEYVSGPSAKGYLSESMFQEKGINVVWFDYVGYPTYPQLWGDFVHEVSILDLLFNCGKDSPRYLRYVKS